MKPILVVASTKTFAELVAQLANEAGYEAEMAVGATSAMAELKSPERSGEYQLIVIEGADLGTMNAVSFLIEVLYKTNHAKTPIIFIADRLSGMLITENVICMSDDDMPVQMPRCFKELIKKR